jgi:hypothetical protein
MRADLVSGMQQTSGPVHGTSTSIRAVDCGFQSWSMVSRISHTIAPHLAGLAALPHHLNTQFPSP